MRRRFFFCLQLCTIIIIFTVSGYAQSASATWALTADTASVTSGNVTATVQYLTNADTGVIMTVRDYVGGTTYSGSPVGLAQRIWRNSYYWNHEDAQNDNRYIQYSISPVSGNSLTVASVALNIGEFGWTAGSTGLRANIFWSKDSTFSTRTRLNADTLALVDARTTALSALSYTLSASISEGETFYLRVYPYSTYKSPSSSKYVLITDVVISGITTSLVSPSLAVFPDSIDFGMANINTSRGYKTFIISGTNLSPASDSIRLTAPDGFVLSTASGSGYSSYIALPYSSGTLSTDTVYVKFLPSLVQSYTGTISVEGGGVAAQYVKVTGTGMPADYPIGIFVATTGSDSSAGTYDAPFRTIQKAISTVQAGDTIFVRSGQYVMDTVTVSITASGTSASRHCLFGYAKDSERPLLDFSAMPFGRRGILLTGNYWHIKGLDIYKAGDNGMRISGSNNIIEYCSFSENQGTGLQLTANASNNQIINCDSYFNYDAPTLGANADGFAPKQMTGINNYFYGCRSWQNSDDGWDCYEAAASVTLENCWTFANGYLKNGSDPGSQANGNGFKMGGNYTDNDITLIKCLAFSNKSKGFDQNHNRGSMNLINCTSYGNIGYNYSIYEDTLDNGKTLELTNCAELGNKRSIGAFAILTTNSWQLFTVSAADFISTDTAGVRAARKTDGSLPDIDFMHLAQGSQMINAGTNAGLPYNGSAPDLGCFESNYGSGVNEENASGISGFKLLQNYPNPFNPSTAIQFSVAKSGRAKLKIINVLGQEIATLFFGHVEAGKINSVQFNAESLPSGVYFSVLESYGERQVRKMMLLK